MMLLLEMRGKEVGFGGEVCLGLDEGIGEVELFRVMEGKGFVNVAANFKID